MTRTLKAAICGVAATAALVVTTVDQAEAQRRGRGVGAAIVGGLIIGGIVAGAAAANAGERRAYRSEGCGYFRRQAQQAEYNGRYNRARGWWERYEACQAGY
jgi:hypothetical protein